MKLIQGRVNSNARIVSTKHGERAVCDVTTEEGNTLTIWGAATDRHVGGRVNGERVTVAIDSKGKASLVETASNSPAVGLAPEPIKLPFEAEMQLKRQLGFQAEAQPSRSVEIAGYIERLGKLYGHCLTTANGIPATGTLDAPEVKDIATTLFIQTGRHFDL